MKKLINSPQTLLREMIEGFAALDPGIAILDDEAIVVRSDLDAVKAKGQVALISGGGSGHEPAHAGYVGQGMLTAAVCGDVFTSPSVDSVLAAIRACAGAGGVLLIVKSYTGDRLNFGLAAELARAEGIDVQQVIVDDDVALSHRSESAGRRGLAGTVLIHKIAGAAAAAGLPLAAVKAEAQAAIAALGTMGVALSSCTVPAAGRPGFELGADEIEMGLGIHGETGLHRAKLTTADDVVRQMLDHIVKDKAIGSGDRVALLVNGLGGTPSMELAVVARSALATLAQLGMVVERIWAGSFLTALEMAGCSLSLLKVDEARLSRLDAPARALAWPSSAEGAVVVRRLRSELAAPKTTQSMASHSPATATARALLAALIAALRAAEPHLTRLDQIVGDGDLGISLSRGCEAVESERETYDLSQPSAVLRGLSDTLRRVIGGTSGPLYAAFLTRAAATLGPLHSPSPQHWSASFAAACAAIADLGGAREGDRTMLDALLPAQAAFASAVAAGRGLDFAVTRAADAAAAGAEGTAGMTPRRGRSSYVGDRALGTPDPGAVAVGIWLRALADGLTGIPGGSAAKES